MNYKPVSYRWTRLVGQNLTRFFFFFFDIPNFFIEIQVEGKNNEFARQDNQQQGQRDNEVSGSAAGDRQTWVSTSLSLDDPGQTSLSRPQFSPKQEFKRAKATTLHSKNCSWKAHAYSTEPVQSAADPNRRFSRWMRQPFCKIYLLIPLLEPRDLGLHFPASCPQG